MKERNHSVTYIDTENALDKIQCSFMIKTQYIKNRREFPQNDKGHIKQSTANIMLNGERLQIFLLRRGTRQDAHF